MAELRGQAHWPGANSIESARYTISHGITPGMATIRMAPQSQLPALNGELILTDGQNRVRLPDCRVEDLRAERDDRGLYWSLTIVDRRWRWRDFAKIEGWYNQLDRNGKLIPWTIRSPTELATLCLQGMSEVNYELRLPPGLDRAIGRDVRDYLVAGLQFPSTGTNPPINWEGVPPAQALQQLADLFGCRVIYRLSTDTVLVAPVNVGAGLPASGRSIHRVSPTLRTPELPDRVGVRGDPTRYQVRLKLIPVGEEWDGSYRPIDLLSYAPRLPGEPGKKGQAQVARVRIATSGDAGVNFQVFLGAKPDEAETSGALFEYITLAADTADLVAVQLASLINASLDPRVKGKIRAASATNTVTLTAETVGVAFAWMSRASGSPPPGNDTTDTLIKQAEPAAAGRKGGASWANCVPPLFYGVNETDRLTLAEARALAQKTVWRYYQVADEDVSGPGPIQVPGYPGAIVRRQQLVLEDTQVDQITPEKSDPGILTPREEEFVANFYNGYSRNRPARVYGSVAVSFLGRQAIYAGYKLDMNTPEGSDVFVPFTIDPDWQLVKFSDPVFLGRPIAHRQMQYLPPKLCLQTAVLVRDQDTNQVQTYEQTAPLTDGRLATATRYARHSDVQLNVSSEYDDKNQVVSTTILEADPLIRARYYLEGLVAQYRFRDAQIVEYNGIVPIDCDGAIQQVTWMVGGGQHATTVASRGTEHDLWVPPYPARRRQELLAPALQEELVRAWGRRGGAAGL
jgi:hypothetical protein